MKNIDKFVEQIVQEQLAPAEIVKLTVEEAEDADDDPILRIDVVFKAAGDRLDPEKVLGLGRCLRKPLYYEFNADLFPIFSFMTPEEASDAAA